MLHTDRTGTEAAAFAQGRGDDCVVFASLPSEIVSTSLSRRKHVQNLQSVVTLRERLRAIVSRDLFRAPQEANARLYADVADVVDELRDLGWSPERIVVAIKEITEEAGLRHSKLWLRVGGQQTPRDELVAQIVRWGIQRYVEASIQRSGETSLTPTAPSACVSLTA